MSEQTILTAELRQEFESLCERYPDRKAALLPILHRVQAIHGCLDRRAQQEVADFLGTSAVEVHGVVTFYPMFREKPIGKHLVSVCKNISCDLMGSDNLLAAIQRKFAVQPGETCTDPSFTLEAVQCQGACGYGPMMVVDGHYHENLDAAKAVQILEDLKA
ncbi:MAG: NAD(P)H-dependent oxidoreductase subunit E [Planctomycetota bacterium]|nr:MAG: NAD(P)H-dependent oxidoreductase subunit E [Planctomycetota bacterium]